jgi:hypothetical protein
MFCALGDELDQSPGDLHGARDVVLPLHRLTDVEEHHVARGCLSGRVLRRYALDLGFGLRDHLGDCLGHGILLVLTAKLSSVGQSNSVLFMLLQYLT